jgi:hypothetical protein
VRALSAEPQNLCWDLRTSPPCNKLWAASTRNTLPALLPLSLLLALLLHPLLVQMHSHVQTRRALTHRQEPSQPQVMQGWQQHSRCYSSSSSRGILSRLGRSWLHHKQQAAALLLLLLLVCQMWVPLFQTGRQLAAEGLPGVGGVAGAQQQHPGEAVRDAERRQCNLWRYLQLCWHHSG